MATFKNYENVRRSFTIPDTWSFLSLEPFFNKIHLDHGEIHTKMDFTVGFTPAKAIKPLKTIFVEK